MAESARIEELRRRVQGDPASIAFAALAEELRRAGRFDEAVATCEAGLLRHPAYMSARVTLGRALLEMGRYDEARTELEHVLRVSPENLAAIRGLAEIHHRTGEAAAEETEGQGAAFATPEEAPAPEPSPPAADLHTAIRLSALDEASGASGAAPASPEAPPGLQSAPSDAVSAPSPDPVPVPAASLAPADTISAPSPDPVPAPAAARAPADTTSAPAGPAPAPRDDEALMALERLLASVQRVRRGQAASQNAPRSAADR
jgi:tetratricopeptide (TPR) repeat protein